MRSTTYQRVPLHDVAFNKCLFGSNLKQIPLPFRELVKRQTSELLELVEIPTNELIAVYKKITFFEG